MGLSFFFYKKNKVINHVEKQTGFYKDEII